MVGGGGGEEEEDGEEDVADGEEGDIEISHRRGRGSLSERQARALMLHRVVHIRRSACLPPGWRMTYLDTPILCFKAVAVSERSLVSIYDGATSYRLSAVTRAGRGTGGDGAAWPPLDAALFVYRTQEAAMNAAFPSRSKRLQSPRVLLSVSVRGCAYERGEECKLAVGAIRVERIIPCDMT
eukprot:jgi/Chlat1/2338/Chrsp17S02614